MSLENHPAFHAVRFSVEVVSSFNEVGEKRESLISKAYAVSLRGKANLNDCPIPTPLIKKFVNRYVNDPEPEPRIDDIIGFVSDIERYVDELTCSHKQ